VCPADALTKVGEYMTVEQVVAEVEKDEIFYWRSGGGVTISGGEPLLQCPFVKKVLKACKERGLHTALDTCGYSPWHLMEEVVEYVDLVLFDIKHMDAKAHEEATGVSNVLSLENLYKIPKHKTVWLRIPLIPGYNDSEENLKKISELGREIGAERISILPYNKFGDGKYENLGRQIPVPEVKPPSQERLHEIQKGVESFGLHVTLGE
jgi:pyruvate formate lyase activating enzyme